MQQNLLDTHTVIWFIEGDAELSDRALELIEGEDTINFVSIATLLEIAIKISLGKLELKGSFKQIPLTFLQNGFEILPISFDDALTLSNLPFHHRDPFDRILVSQALTNELTLISKDRGLASYKVKQIW